MRSAKQVQFAILKSTVGTGFIQKVTFEQMREDVEGATLMGGEGRSKQKMQ